MKQFILCILLCLTIDSVQAESLPFSNGKLIINFLTQNAVRIQYVEQTPYDLPEWIYVNDNHNSRASRFSREEKSTENGRVVTLSTQQMQVVVDTQNQTVSIADTQGKTVFTANRHQLRSATVADLSTYEATLAIHSPHDEYLFGMGQFQDGYNNIRGLSRRLTQVNTQISVPMLLSNKGYGLLWNNYGRTDFNPCQHHVKLVKRDSVGQREIVNVTSTEGGKHEVRERNIFQATIQIQQAGDYTLLLDVGQTMARRHNLCIDGKPVIDAQNLWLPPTVSTIVSLTPGKHTVTAELTANDQPTLYFDKITHQTLLRSPVANAVDYTVFVGSPDEVIAAYRQVTGPAPLMPRWALGYIHCRERFHSSDEILQTANRFRNQQIPLDLIVQDWQWWGKYGWNAMRFDEDHYPDPKLLVDSLHHMNVRLMLSVWSKIDKSSQLGKEMDEKNYYIPGTDWIDFFNPQAAAAYWQNFSERLLQPYHIDAWWQDATEPENDDLVGRRVDNGKYPGELFRNVYPLLVNKTVYEGLRNDDPQRRPMILTRCGFPGIQRYGAATWSGDIGNDWQTLRYQITAGLGMMAAGLPWWTYDAGGFFRPGNQYNDPAYIQRMLRWIQTSVYLPLMRVHGYISNTEPWNYGPEAQDIITDNIRQRHRLLPYIYTYAAEIHRAGGTLMRPLVFDFPDDTQALRQQCEYMFGRSLLICPITQANPTVWSCYLPVSKGGWYDFATNNHYDGGQTVQVPVNKRAIPVFVKAGSVLPLQADGYLQLQIYPGADAHFTLYEDEGDNNNYLQGKFTTIPIHWDNQRQQLTIGNRSGSFNGMEKKRTIRVCTRNTLVKTIEYKGKEMKVVLAN